MNNRTLSTQLGVHFEEVTEMLEVLIEASINTKTGIHPSLTNAQAALHLLAVNFKHGDIPLNSNDIDRVEFLDSICDQLVTAAGCAYQMNMDVVGGLDEVNASNYSKFDADGNPIKDENGKVIKGPKYFKPDLAHFT